MPRETTHPPSTPSPLTAPDASGAAALPSSTAAAVREVATLTGHGRDVDGVAFSPDGTRLAAGSEDGTVKLWDVAPR